MDLDHVPPPLRLVPLSGRSVIFPTKLEDLSQLDLDAKKSIAEIMQTTLASS